MHVLRQLRPRCMEGSWQSRTNHGEVRDIGDTTVPLYIARPTGGKVDMQACVQQWSAQDLTHALVNPPALLCIQLERFVRRNRAIRKKSIPIAVGDVQMPMYVNASDRTVQIPYRLIAAIVHSGNSPNSGHYRSVLVASTETELIAERGSGRFQAYHTDDGVSAVAVDSLDAFDKDVYLLWFLKATA